MYETCGSLKRGGEANGYGYLWNALNGVFYIFRKFRDFHAKMHKFMSQGSRHNNSNHSNNGERVLAN